jgi:hypothetical protein
VLLGGCWRYDVTENAKLAMSSRERLSLAMGLMLPGDARPIGLNGDTSEVWNSVRLKLLTGMSYAA